MNDLQPFSGFNARCPKCYDQAVSVRWQPANTSFANPSPGGADILTGTGGPE